MVVGNSYSGTYSVCPLMSKTSFLVIAKELERGGEVGVQHITFIGNITHRVVLEVTPVDSFFQISDFRSCASLKPVMVPNKDVRYILIDRFDPVMNPESFLWKGWVYGRIIVEGS